MFGDSLTDRGEWHELLAVDSVANRGISGDTIAQARERVESIRALHPTTVVVMLGINDLLVGRSVSSCVTEYRALLSVLSATPSPRIVVQSVLPVGAQVALAPQQIRQLNEQLRELCTPPHCEFVDVWSAFADPTGSLDSALSSDGVHLNGRGYARWAEVLRSVLIR